MKIFLKLFTLLALASFVITATANAYTKPSQAEIKQKLTPMQYNVTQKAATEPAFKNAYWNNKEPGIYVDVVTGEPLFSSRDKFKSGTGWPSFTKPIDGSALSYKDDYFLFFKRIEVLSKVGGSHLGHVFDDGPAPTGKRYCVNSAALKFIPLKDMQKLGYGAYIPYVK